MLSEKTTIPINISLTLISHRIDVKISQWKFTHLLLHRRVIIQMHGEIRVFRNFIIENPFDEMIGYFVRSIIIRAIFVVDDYQWCRRCWFFVAGYEIIVRLLQLRLRLRSNQYISFLHIVMAEHHRCMEFTQIWPVYLRNRKKTISKIVAIRNAKLFQTIR